MIDQVVPYNVQNRAFNEFRQPQNGWYLGTQKTEEEKKKHKWGLTIAASAIGIGFGTLILMRGSLPKKAVEYLGKLKLELEKRVQKGGKFVDFYKKSIDTINSVIEKSQSLNNITSLKDILFQKIMFLTKGTKKIHKGISKIFKNIARKTVNTSYAQTDRRFTELNEYVMSLNKWLNNTHPKDPNIEKLVKSVENALKEINTDFNKGFGIQARTERLAEIDKATKGLYEYMWDASYGDIKKNFLSSKDIYQKFVAEAHMIPVKNKLSAEVSGFSKGLAEKLEKMLEGYKNVLSDSEYKSLKSKADKALKSLDNSISKETVSYVDKARDLKLGSAPTDVLSILFSMGAVGWYLNKSDNKDEKISAALKYGIPAVGAVATSLLCTAKLISGGKSLAIALASGWVINKLGVMADDARKQYKLDVSLTNRKKLSENKA